jgi:hypothetical protein
VDVARKLGLVYGGTRAYTGVVEQSPQCVRHQTICRSVFIKREFRSDLY